MARPDLVHGESIGGLPRGIPADLRLLVREEIALARVELRERAGRARAAARFGASMRCPRKPSRR